MYNKYYTIKEVSCLIKTPIPYLRKMIKKHKLIASFIGKQYIIDEIDLKNYIDSCKGSKNER